MERALDQGVFPGAVLACTVQGQVRYCHGFGVANLETQVPVTTRTIFDLASLTKPLATTLALAELMKQRPELLSTPLKELIPAFAGTDKAGITVDMLLRHRSGYPAHEKYFLKVSQNPTPGAALQKALVDQPLASSPGEKEVYSDLGFMVLAWVVETLAQTSLDLYVRERIFTPLGVDTLFFIPDADRAGVLNRYGHRMAATQHCPWRKRLLVGEVDDENAWAVGGVAGHAGLFGDVTGVLILCEEIRAALENRTTRLVDPAILQALARKKGEGDKVGGFDTPSSAHSSAGRHFSPQSVGHLGFTGTSFWIDPADGIIVVLLTNRIHPTRSNERLKSFRPKIHDLIHSELA